MSMMKMTHRQSNSIGTTKGMRCTKLCLVTVPVRPAASQAEQGNVTMLFARRQAMGVGDNLQAPIHP